MALTQCTSVVVFNLLQHWPSNYIGLHQQTVNWSGSYLQTSQTLQLTSPVILMPPWCSQSLLNLRKLLSESTREFSGDPKSTCHYGGAFRMFWDLTHMVFEFWNSWDPFARQCETSRAAAISAHLCSRAQAIFLHRSFSAFDNHNAFLLSYLSWLQWQDSLHHYMASNILVSVYMYLKYSSISWGASADANCSNLGMYLQAAVAEQCISKHHHHSISQGKAAGSILIAWDNGKKVGV